MDSHCRLHAELRHGITNRDARGEIGNQARFAFAKQATPERIEPVSFRVLAISCRLEPQSGSQYTPPMKTRTLHLIPTSTISPSSLRPRGTVAEPPRPLRDLLLLHSHHVDGDRVEAHALEQVLGLLVDVEHAALAVLGEVEGRDLGHVLVLPLTLFFLELEGDAADGATLDALHQVGGETGDLGGMS